MVEEVQRHSVHTLVFRSLKRTHDMFLSDEANLPDTDEASEAIRVKGKILSEYRPVLQAVRESNKEKRPQLALPSSNQTSAPQLPPSGFMSRLPGQLMITGGTDSGTVAPTPGSFDFAGFAATGQPFNPPSGISSEHLKTSSHQLSAGQQFGGDNTTRSLLPSKKIAAPRAKWHPPWKLYRVISGHTGWVRCVDVDPSNQWFATGAADRMVKIWDLASGTLKLSLTGHVSAVRAVKISDRHPYMFSAGEDKQVKCWDLEHNKVIRHYHGHLSACTSLALHPTLDVLLSTGRDCVVRVWDMRTKAQIHSLVGHTNTTASVQTQAAEPQVISGSHDTTIRMWDMAAGRSVGTLTNHKKSVRAVVIHPELYMFASASPDNIKQWKGSKGEFVRNLSGHNAIINSLAVNRDNVLVSGGDNGSMHYWDWTSGHCFQKTMSKAQSGSIDSEAGIFAMTFDQSGSRLLTGEADKTIKCYKEDEEATEETHPVIQRPDVAKKNRY